MRACGLDVHGHELRRQVPEHVRHRHQVDAARRAAHSALDLPPGRRRRRRDAEGGHDRAAQLAHVGLRAQKKKKKAPPPQKKTPCFLGEVSVTWTGTETRLRHRGTPEKGQKASPPKKRPARRRGRPHGATENGRAPPHLRIVRTVHQAVLQEVRHAVGEQRVALHLAEADASGALAAFQRLLREVVHRARRPDLVLVRHHVPQPLVVHDADVDVRLELLARHPAVHGLVAVVVVTGFQQLLAEVVRGVVEPGPRTEQPPRHAISRERRGVLRDPVQRAALRGDALHEHPDGHPRREGVRVYDDVGLHPGLGKRQVHGRILLAAHALLPVAGGELVADDRRPRDPQLDLDPLELVLARVTSCFNAFRRRGGDSA
ncbi:MAG: hypothetical protein BJ554DRAFT_127 [Olpidium bornovanus]|uniref:Uncharacterized protein n=1 Tax=Olpidium bornovanus TaxID=278681 RepID=A0A8H7ZUT8_9FUNG|nr:MAG: hypothetical protein BJ554DRAFT_127 [Olpidium bornovanus]